MVNLEEVKEEFIKLRKDIKTLNPNFTVNLHTIDKITVDISSSIYTDNMNDLTIYIAQLTGAKVLIENFYKKYNQ